MMTVSNSATLLCPVRIASHWNYRASPDLLATCANGGNITLNALGSQCVQKGGFSGGCDEGLVVPPVPGTPHQERLTLCTTTALSSAPRRPMLFSRWACGESGDPRGRLCPAERAMLRQRFCRQRLRASCAASCESTESLPWPGALTKGMQAKHSARYADSCGVSPTTRRTLPCGSALSTSSK